MSGSSVRRDAARLIRREALVGVLGALALMGSGGVALAAPGDLDSSFGGDGKSLADLGGTDVGQGVALQPDGKIVVAGFSNGNFAVARLRSSGSFDSSFGSGGKSLADLGGSDVGTSVALQPDGKMVVAGSSGGNFAVARLLSNGFFDTSFGFGGRSLADLGGNDVGQGVALQPDGKIVVAGFSSGNFAVARLQSNGFFDPSFGSGGRSLADLGANDAGRAVALQPDGKIVVAGTSGGNFAVARLQSNGFFDSSFGSGGRSLADLGGTDIGQAVALQPDGKIVVAGPSDGDFAVARLRSSGFFDSSFGSGGKSLADIGGSGAARAVALQPDGKILVAGSSDGDFAVARLLGDGPLLGRSVGVEPRRGQVYVSVPVTAAVRAAQVRSVPGIKGRKFVSLRQARQLPVGSLLDTRRGTVRLTSARGASGKSQTADFSSGVFQVLQSRSRRAKGLTDLVLKGLSFRKCGRRASRSSFPVQASRRSRRAIRRLRGRGKGRFRTRGRYSAATVRGTDWTVTDRCDGTLTTVRRGRVRVRDRRKRRNVLLRAGKRYLAKAPGVR